MGEPSRPQKAYLSLIGRSQVHHAFILLRNSFYHIQIIRCSFAFSERQIKHQQEHSQKKEHVCRILQLCLVPGSHGINLSTPYF